MSTSSASGYISSLIAGGDGNYTAQAGDYLMLLCLLLVICFGMIYQSRMTNKDQALPEFVEFQRRYLVAYVLMVGADWMQGPFVYKLYSFYGYSKGEIGFLFVAGFLSSAVFGTIIGGLADRFGRKKLCMLYGIIYAISCFTKHSTDFNVLLCGRLLAGIASSILHSAFESWLISEHRRCAFPEEWIAHNLSLMSFFKGGVAIVSAIVANFLASNAGYVAPFDMAAVLLIAGVITVQRTWKENFGDPTSYYGRNFAHGWIILASNPRVWLLGIIQASFEGAMFLFVFSWTPHLESTQSDIPHGLIFASFMVAIMIGSHAHEMVLKRYTNETVASVTFALAAFSLLVPGLVASHWISLLSYVVFEGCVGVYFPCVGVQRARHIPNEVRATIMTFFRIPLNIVVVVSLLNVSQMTTFMISTLCFIMLCISFFAQVTLSRLDGQGFITSAAFNSEKDKGASSSSSQSASLPQTQA